MLKKVILIAAALCLIVAVGVMAENESVVVEKFAPEMSEQILQNPQELPEEGRENVKMPPSGDMKGRIPPNMPDGKIPPEGVGRGQRTEGSFTPPQNAGEFIPPQKDVQTRSTETSMPNANDAAEKEQTQENGEASAQMQDANNQPAGQMHGGMGGFPGNMQSFNGQPQEEQIKGFWGFVKAYSTPIISLVLLGLAFIFVVFYKRKNY